MDLSARLRLIERMRQGTGAEGRPLFLTLQDVNPARRVPSVTPIKRVGPYSSYRELCQTQHDLLAEDFRRAVSEQINEIRANPKLLSSSAHYEVKAERVLLTQNYGRSGRHQIGVKMYFDPKKYGHVRWDEDKRFLTGNLVFLSRNGMNTFDVGVVHDSSPHHLRKGCVVIKMISGVNSDEKYFRMLDQSEFVGKTYHLVESAAFYFPYLHVTNALRENRFQSLFTDEIVRGQTSQPPAYLSHVSSGWRIAHLRADVVRGLNKSQAAAFESVLQRRVALVQGPPGTGKTYLGCKIAEYFVSLKGTNPNVFRGPILVVTTTNHAVHEFLSRCLLFTNKLIHGYSDKHGRSQYGELQETYDESSQHEKTDIMREADILAMTTTRAAYMRSTLDLLGINIGDHKQLQPSCSHHALAGSHNLDLSLFERLINNGLECPMLNEQRRMRPSIKKLVANIYPSLTNHPSTAGRPPVKGVDLKTPVFFINKAEPETREGTGYCHAQEAEMAAELGAYLLQQGYDADKITILTTYRKQLGLVLKHLRHIGGDAKTIRATCVDNFQGEENEIIILSLVRSNSSGCIGFLEKENRACVALSRARTGFFMLGNLTCLAASGSASWRHVSEVLAKARRVGPALPLVCPHGLRFSALSAADVREAKEGCALCRLAAALAEAERFTETVAAELDTVKMELAALTGDAANEELTPEERLEALAKKAARLNTKKRLERELRVREAEEKALREQCGEAEVLFKQGKVDLATETLESLQKKLSKSGVAFEMSSLMKRLVLT
ncbi:NFX1-type zinc finger-containing protein 1-like isoform X2 [Thrips palmi]|uniref:NFX1-type zinc finger-containing protein 1-like isoform X2 n=1 Tax=Thrips palmi TaxID=161013 RepID=A0A6P8Y9X2_THRPL|nr:NFX1-type zinc finger-containing protein 1-like isoform X2 [Thrips palmi]